MFRILIGVLLASCLVLTGCDDSDPADPCLDVNCDDGVDCTVDECEADSGDCTYTPDDSLCEAAETCDAELGCQASPCEDDSDCDDGDFCNGTETCDAVLGTCQSGTAADCADAVDCTDDSCNEDNDACQNTPNDDNCAAGETCDPVDGCQGGGECVDDTDCDDGLFCNGAETCNAGSCVAGTPVVCDDSIGCTADSCNENLGACENLPDHDLCSPGELCDPEQGGCVAVSCLEDSDCHDGFFCNGAETCVSETCEPGIAVLCDDGVDCTEDVCSENDLDCDYTPNDSLCADGEICDPDAGCTEAPCEEDADCDDGLFCNGAESCDAGDCFDGTPVDCNDGVNCTVDSCDEDNDACEHLPDHELCPDGEMCDPALGCTAIGCESDSDCDDGLFCNGDETCDGTICQPGTPPVCDDGVTCTDDSCDEAGDACVHDVNDANCDDGAFCNGAETCHATDDCQDGTPVDCDDGVSCTDDDCDEDADACTHTPDDGLCDDSVDCTDDTCDLVVGGCVYTADDTFCEDGDLCNGAETCDDTLGCQGGTPVDCDDGVDCTIDDCDPDSGLCGHAPDDGYCDNGLFCDGAEFCHATDDCQNGTDPCVDGVGCTDDSCDDSDDGCIFTANDLNCDNGAYCDGDETCHVTDDCQDGTPVNCDDQVDCTHDSCNETDEQCDHVEDNDLCDDTNPCTLDFCDSTFDPPGCLHAQVPNGTACADDTVCNGDEICMNGMCRAGYPLICQDDNPCTHNYCSSTAGCLANSEPDGLPCPDGDLCNGDETCLAGACQAGSSLDCDDGNMCTDDDCTPHGGCAWYDNADACDDGDPCTSQDVCAWGTCAGQDIEICGDLVDNDCDGDTDENCPADIGTYVAPWGDDSDPGTMALPVETVMRGIANAEIIQSVSGEPQHVYVAGDNSHVYYENFVMLPGISVWGGYSNDGLWTRDPAAFETYLEPSTAMGVQFYDAAIDRSVFLDGFVIWGQSAIGINNSSTAIYIDQAAPTLSNNWIFAGNMATCFGVSVTSFGFPLITDNHIEGGLCNSSSRAVFVSGADAEIIDNVIDGGQSPTTMGIHLDSPGWAVIDHNDIWGGLAGAIVGPITGASTVGVHINGTILDGVMVTYNDIVGGNAGGSNYPTAVGVAVSDCNGMATYIEDNLLIEGGIARSGVSEAWAMGVNVVGNCPAHVRHNLAILGGEQPADVGVGVICRGGAPCIIDDNVWIQGSVDGHAMNDGAIGVLCEGSCTSVSRNQLVYGGWGAAAVGMAVIGTPSVDVDRNHIYAGMCSSGGQGLGGIGVEVSMTGAVFTNNVIFGGMCSNTYGVIQFNEVDPSGLVLHPNFNGNYINGEGSPDSSGRSTGLFIIAEGNIIPPQGDYRNNIINAGYAMQRTGVAESGPGADPRAVDYNDIIGSNTAVYVDEGSMALQSIGAVNGLTDMITGNNILEWPALVNEIPWGDFHLTEFSPCRDGGTSEGAPDHDMDDESRPAGQFFDIGADEYH